MAFAQQNWTTHRDETIGVNDCDSKRRVQLNAMQSLQAQRTIEAAKAHLVLEAQMHGSGEWEKEAAKSINDAHVHTSTLVGAPPSKVFFVQGSEEQSIRSIVDSLNIGHDQTIVQHAALIKPARMPCAIAQAPTDAHGLLDVTALLAHIEQENSVALVVIPHVDPMSGMEIPVARIAEAAHNHGARVLVDGTCSIGLFAVDASVAQADIWIASGHGYLRAPRGVTVCVAGDTTVQDTLRADPFFCGYMQAYTPESSGLSTLAFAVAFGTACAAVNELGLLAVQEKIHELVVDIEDGLKKISAVEQVSCVSGADHKKSVAVRFCAPASTGDFKQELSVAGIVITSTGTLLEARPHYYNNKSDVDLAMSRISNVVGQARAISVSDDDGSDSEDEWIHLGLEEKGMNSVVDVERICNNNFSGNDKHGHCGVETEEQKTLAHIEDNSELNETKKCAANCAAVIARNVMQVVKSAALDGVQVEEDYFGSRNVAIDAGCAVGLETTRGQAEASMLAEGKDVDGAATELAARISDADANGIAQHDVDEETDQGFLIESVGLMLCTRPDSQEPFEDTIVSESEEEDLEDDGSHNAQGDGYDACAFSQQRFDVSASPDRANDLWIDDEPGMTSPANQSWSSMSASSFGDYNSGDDSDSFTEVVAGDSSETIFDNPAFSAALLSDPLYSLDVSGVSDAESDTDDESDRSTVPSPVVPSSTSAVSKPIAIRHVCARRKFDHFSLDSTRGLRQILGDCECLSASPPPFVVGSPPRHRKLCSESQAHDGVPRSAPAFTWEDLRSSTPPPIRSGSLTNISQKPLVHFGSTTSIDSGVHMLPPQICGSL